VIEIKLSADEMLAGAIVAAKHKITCDDRRATGKASRRPEHYEEERTWDQEIESSLAEIAVCSFSDHYWTGSRFDGTSGTDAGSMQVRWTRHPNGHLIVYEEDPPNAYYVLVVGRSPVFQIVGWIKGVDARKPIYWRTSALCPSWWVPQEALVPFKERAA